MSDELIEFLRANYYPFRKHEGSCFLCEKLIYSDGLLHCDIAYARDWQSFRWWYGANVYSTGCFSFVERIS